MSLTKVSTGVVDMSGNTGGLVIAKGNGTDVSSGGERPTCNATILGSIRENTTDNKVEVCTANGGNAAWRFLKEVSPLLTVDYLVVAGGGGGSSGYGGSPQGGGGAGGLRTSYGSISGGGGSVETLLTLTAGTPYPITVGVGGVGATNSSATIGAQGTSSSFDTISTVGGGGSRNWNSGLPSGTGGSGGGEAYATNGGPGQGTQYQGYAGGSVTVNGPGAGGGGAGSAGSWAANPTFGIGGDGLDIDITGSTVSYAGGGGRTVGTPRGGGGISASSLGPGGNGLPNTGGGGGGGATTNASAIGGSGGTGVVILRYPSYYTGAIGGGLIHITDTTTVSGYTIERITSGTGTITFAITP